MLMLVSPPRDSQPRSCELDRLVLLHLFVSKRIKTTSRREEGRGAEGQTSDMGQALRTQYRGLLPRNRLLKYKINK